jgi:acetyl-CoA C-acetyltransferase
VILSNDKSIISKSRHSVSVLASEVATDSISLSHRKRLDELEATKIAAQKAFKQAKLKPADIQVAELHDCFSIAELLAMEDIGFFKKGRAGAEMLEMPTQFGSGSKLIVNTSGGLKAAGHPVGATGIKQIGEIFLQLTKSAGNRQVEQATHGLAHNVGGSGGTAAVTILGI